ncbi:hypothetical protein PCANC_04347 [Puccinia coronata f. sp. avenae]|uniref:tRNA ligase kinase domain-containing protein n=1 Tax=Puccinia coronata f. sp. avenae TaxID=200324 RepID=A0A2N5T922_9BASI|nr:hypothetical protein PCANC_04347 [Puccinia coronata f. sp. avenae]
MQTIDHQRVLVLCGFVGSGKSSFAIELEKFNPNFIRISQDVLGKRQVCEAVARRSLREGKSIIIDRQNFDRKQRSTWIQIANEFAGLNSGCNVACDVIEFATPYEECAKRLQVRTGHESIHTVQEGMGILKLVSSQQWVPPDVSEGFTRHLVLLPPGCSTTHPARATLPFPITPEAIQHILATLNSIPITQHPPQTLPTHQSNPRPARKTTFNRAQRDRGNASGKGDRSTQTETIQTANLS